MERSRPVAAAIILLAGAVFVAWLAIQGPPTMYPDTSGGANGTPRAVEASNRAVGIVMLGITVILGAGAVALLARTRQARRLGRLGGAVLVAAGAYLAWWVLVVDTGAWKAMMYLLSAPFVVAFVAAGLVVLLLLRR
ncbi:MAG: hypothetical protein MUC54_00600 [Chloroflexi bacterium]|nr:hypothetical protein [Chloroflexota bacterium]